MKGFYRALLTIGTVGLAGLLACTEPEEPVGKNNNDCARVDSSRNMSRQEYNRETEIETNGSFTERQQLIIANRSKRSITECGLDILVEDGVPRDIAISYGSRFIGSWGFLQDKKSDDPLAPITLMHRIGLSPEIANEYDERFNVYSVIDLFEGGISSEVANPYDIRFLFKRDIQRAIKIGLTAEEANKYEHRPPDLSKPVDWAYGEASLVIDHFERGLSYTQANKYDKSFNQLEVRKLDEASVSPEEANQ